MISNCGHDENGKYTGGRAGDQTGSEWMIQKWYNRPWNVILRHPDRSIGKKIAELATQAAENDLIGYDQGNRTSFWEQLKASGYIPANIKTACESDCSAGVAAIVKAVGYLIGDAKLKKVSASAYTGNLRAALVAAGFQALTDTKYLASDEYLLPGDVLLYEGHHTAINLDSGSNAAEQTEDLAPVSGMDTIRTGSKGNQVSTLQRILNALGYSCGTVDGDFGQKTKSAIIAFQSHYGLEADGICGPKSWTMLLKGC